MTVTFEWMQYGSGNGTGGSVHWYRDELSKCRKTSVISGKKIKEWFNAPGSARDFQSEEELAAFMEGKVLDHPEISRLRELLKANNIDPDTTDGRRILIDDSIKISDAKKKEKSNGKVK